MIEQEIRVQVQLQDIQLSDSFFTSADYSALLAKMSTELRGIIRDALASLRSEYERSSEILVSEVAREAETRIRAVGESKIKAGSHHARNLLFTAFTILPPSSFLAQSEVQSASGTSVQLLVGSILNDIRPTVRQSVRTMIANQFEIFSGDDSSFVESMTERVVLRITQYTREQVEYFLKQLRNPPQPPPTVVARTPSWPPAVGGKRLQSIFGISGANNVKLETPGYQYAYISAGEED